MDQKPQDKKHRLWSWLQFAVALCLIPIGLFISIWGLGVVISSHPYELRYGLGAIAIPSVLGGLCITVGGIIWIIVLLIRLIVLHRRSRRS